MLLFVPLQLPLNPGPVLSVFDFDPEEIARQLTMIDYSLFAKIKPAELLNQAWQKPKYKHRAQNILRIVERMNNLTLWVATTILSQKDVQQRAKRITDFVQICVVSVHVLYIHVHVNLSNYMYVACTCIHVACIDFKKHMAIFFEDVTIFSLSLPLPLFLSLPLPLSLSLSPSLSLSLASPSNEQLLHIDGTAQWSSPPLHQQALQEFNQSRQKH